MSNLIKINPDAEYNENLYPSTKINYTVVGTAGSSVAYDNFSVNNDKSIKCTSITTAATVLNLNESITAPYSGLYAFSLYFNKTNPAYEWQVGINVYINGIFSETLSVELLNTSSNYNDYNWNVYGQNINLNQGDILTLSLRVSTGTIGNVLYVSAPKLELLDKGFSLPSIYTYPSNYYKNPYSGWAYYVDSLATPTITIGTSYTQITIDTLGASITSYLPKEIRGVSQLFSGSKITPISIGDDYDGRFDCTVTAKTGTPTLIEFIIDISGSTAGTNKAFTGYIQTGGALPYDQSLPIDFFTLSTFIANGGKLYAKVDSGSITIGRRNIKITRKSKYFI